MTLADCTVCNITNLSFLGEQVRWAPNHVGMIEKITRKKKASLQNHWDFHRNILSTKYLEHTGFPFVYGGAGGRDTSGDYQLSMHTGLSHIHKIPAECESVWGKPENSTHPAWPHYWRAWRTQQGTAHWFTPMSVSLMHTHTHFRSVTSTSIILRHIPVWLMHHPSSWVHLRLAHWLKRDFFFWEMDQARILLLLHSYEVVHIDKSLKPCNLSPFWIKK